MPVSVTREHDACRSRVTRASIVTWPPAGVNFTAFVSRLMQDLLRLLAIGARYETAGRRSIERQVRAVPSAARSSA